MIYKYYRKEGYDWAETRQDIGAILSGGAPSYADTGSMPILTDCISGDPWTLEVSNATEVILSKPHSLYPSQRVYFKLTNNLRYHISDTLDFSLNVGYTGSFVSEHNRGILIYNFPRVMGLYQTSDSSLVVTEIETIGSYLTDSNNFMFIMLRGASEYVDRLKQTNPDTGTLVNTVSQEWQYFEPTAGPGSGRFDFIYHETTGKMVTYLVPFKGGGTTSRSDINCVPYFKAPDLFVMPVPNTSAPLGIRRHTADGKVYTNISDDFVTRIY